MNAQPTIFIVDDDAAVRTALSMLLKSAGYAFEAFASAKDFLAACNPECHGCIILDVNMPGMDGPALQQELRRRGVLLPLIFLTGYGDIATTVRTIKAGAVDFLTKPVDGSILLNRVQEALKQDARLRGQADDYQSIASRLAALTKREREIMVLVVNGHTSKEIAQHFAISFRTVEAYRARIMLKTGARSLPELTRLAISANKLNSPPP